MRVMQAPFPWFGGKSRIAHTVWKYFGDVPNYVEPFAGSLAVLLRRPHEPQVETVNDLDCYLANFWRAMAADPERLAYHADWPVNEADLQARHTWLRNQPEFRERMKSDPDYYDVKIAGWWVWGISAWIGGGWCEVSDKKKPHLNDSGVGVHRKRPHLSRPGMGVHRSQPSHNSLLEYFAALSARLRRVRVCCGDWTRVVTPAVTLAPAPFCGVFLDPPYDLALRDPNCYAIDSEGLSAEVREWAIQNGDNPALRIALCSYEGEHKMPAGWRKVSWKAQGGYANLGKSAGQINRHLERVWFSPHCLRQERQLDILDLLERKEPHDDTEAQGISR